MPITFQHQKLRMQDLTVTGNQIEAILWFVFSAGFVIRAVRTTRGHRRLAVILTLAFLAFGVSDLIEARTGAWWRPAWLLILKAACVGVFAYGLWEHLRLRGTTPPPPRKDGGPE